ncbi:MAG TPA: hypothetical protein VFE62_16120 [Gemmataceae bacterium]|nr:hypothetical protein [Gemmataceae bacterium]
MASAFDPRIVQIELQLPGQTVTFDNQNPSLAIYASGSKFGTANMNTCECRIFNLTKQLRNQILTLASPLLAPPANNPAAALPNPRQPVILNLKVGRVSTGTFLLFTGNVITCEVTQPPDIGIVLRSLTNNYNMSLLLGLQQPAVSRLSEIAQVIAQNNGLFLDFEATDKNINNYSFTGSLQNNIVKLNQMGGVQAGVDNQTLWVIDAGKARKNTGFTITDSSGMVGIPQVTEQGVTVRVMINSAIQIGGSVTINSTSNPAANGTFKVAKMDYEIASRDQPFWYTLLCSNLGVFQGQT